MLPLILLIGGAAGCSPVASGTASRQPERVRQPGFFRNWPVGESSGVIASRTMPGRFWTLNDSGNAGVLFAFDSTAADPVDFVALVGGTNVDWEAISAGPCDSAWCLYVGDIGDNRAVRPSVTIYRVVEPDRTVLDAHQTPVRDSLVVRYPDGPRDAEAMVVTERGDVAIISKGWDSVTAFWIPASAWRDGQVVATPIWKLPIVPSMIRNRLVTDAALSPDGETLAVRTYREIYLFRSTPQSKWLPDRPAGVCDISGLEPQGEGIAWATSTTLILTSEILARSPGPVTLLECPAS